MQRTAHLGNNGQANAATPGPAFVQVTADPKAITPENPNGVIVGSNIPPGKADLMIIMLLAEGIQRLVESIRARPAVSANLVMPDGSAAPLPPEKPVNLTGILPQEKEGK